MNWLSTYASNIYAASSNSLELLMLTVMHATIILIPMIAAASLAVRNGLVDPVVLLGIVFCSSGLYAYFVFWIWVFSPQLGALSGISGVAICVAIIIRFRFAGPSQLNFAWWSRILLLWLFFSLFILAAGLAPGGFNQPLDATAERFSHLLPMDNKLPYILSQQIADGHIKSPMIGDWLGSDRPPLQTAYFLASGTSNFNNSELHYQIVGTLLQCLWVIGLFAILKSRNIPSKVSALVVSVAIFSNISIVHSLYVWPKLLPVAFFLIATDIALRFQSIDNKKVAAAVFGISTAMAMLGHGGSVFAIIGLATYLLLKRITPGPLYIAVAAIAFLMISATWTGYQKFIDPPGDRLLKWHLAGVTQVDDRKFLETLNQSYAELTPKQIMQLKLSNFHAMLGIPSAWIPQTIMSSVGMVTNETKTFLRGEQFFGVLPSLGLLSLALLALPFKVLKGATEESKLAKEFLGIAVLAIFAWGILLFGPRFTVIHAGSLATILFCYCGAILLVASRSLTLATVLAVLNISSTLIIYLSFGWKDSTKTLDIGLAMTALASFCVVAIILFEFAKTRRLHLI